MSRTLITVALLFPCLPGCLGTRSESPAAHPCQEPPAYPAFSWDTVPLFGFLSLTAREDLSDDRVRYLARRYPILTICKHKPADPDQTIEEESLRLARRIKAVNNGIKLLYYWNTTLAMSGSSAYADFASHRDWALHDAQGRPLDIRGFALMNTANGRMRGWWSEAAVKVARDPAVDGVFADAVCKYGMGTPLSPYELASGTREALTEGLFQMLVRTRQDLGPGKLLIYNGLRGNRRAWTDGGARFLDCASGAIVEHFAAFSGRDGNGKVIKEQLVNDIELIGEAARRGKIVLVKGWPGNYHWQTPGFKELSGEDRRRILRENLVFPLAAFLVAAEKHCYFSYTFGYLSDCGLFDELDELQRPLGAPRGRAQRAGWVYTRPYEHASVWVDVEHEQARIDWH